MLSNYVYMFRVSASTVTIKLTGLMANKKKKMG